jgi:hypothetical protein
MMMTNAAAVTRIVSRVSEIADERRLRGLEITTETDGTTTFQRETVNVHLFEADRELHVRGPDSAAAAQIDGGADATGYLSQAAAETGAERIFAFLRPRLSAS